MTTTLPVTPDPWTPAAATIKAHGWTKDTERDDAGHMCLVGGLHHCGLASGEWLIARAVARHRDHGERWNDAGGRTESEVVGWLTTAEPITPDELADVFGPQWEAICALTLRAATLTAAETERLNAACGAAWAAAWAAARDAARGAARGAARDAAGGAAWAAARGAAWAAAWAAAGDAAWALVVRDLIDPDTPWTQDAYDALTGPWATAIGPVHPEDVTR